MLEATEAVDDLDGTQQVVHLIVVRSADSSILSIAKVGIGVRVAIVMRHKVRGLDVIGVLCACHGEVGPLPSVVG